MTKIERDILRLVKLRRDPTQKLLVNDYLSEYFYPALYQMVKDGKLEEVIPPPRYEVLTYKVPNND